MKEFIKQITDAWSKPINLTHQIVPRVDPFTLDNVLKYGEISYCWAGTRPRLILKDPELMKEVLANKLGHFQKPPINSLILILSRGLTTLEGEQWSKRRRMINHAFHLEKLKVPFFTFLLFHRSHCSKPFIMLLMLLDCSVVSGNDTGFRIELWRDDRAVEENG
ncbi:Cytochrome P450 [Corchorus capsularis]|uniref:Cytochrome P450 n=1 Tax=Corchorus capsularis TaxID=210143 RepID=A0A1R3HA29_COCAP|nr:Cytochrome P450 [Corchorus capsularis]